MSIQHTESCILGRYDMFPKPVLISLLRALETAYALHRAKWFMDDLLTHHDGDIELLIDAALKLTYEEIERFYSMAGVNPPRYLWNASEVFSFIEYYRRELCKWPSDDDDDDIPLHGDPLFDYPIQLIPDSYYQNNAWYHLQRLGFLNDMKGSLATPEDSDAGNGYDDDDEPCDW